MAIMRIYRRLPADLPAFQRVGLLLLVLVMLVAQGCSRNRFYEATRASAGLAPLAAEHPDAVVLAYRAKLWGFRGIFADHTWLATKAKNADNYTVYEVIGWRLRRNVSALRIETDMPDRHWYGSKPIPMIDLRGPEAEPLVAKIAEASNNYPFPNEYKAFPGPNSNTFTAWVAQQVPELGLHLPLRAVGRSYPLEKAPTQ